MGHLLALIAPAVESRLESVQLRWGSDEYARVRQGKPAHVREVDKQLIVIEGTSLRIQLSATQNGQGVRPCVVGSRPGRLRNDCTVGKWTAETYLARDTTEVPENEGGRCPP